MKIIIITPPHTVDGEICIIAGLFELGLESLHLRKPDFSFSEMRDYILQIDERYRHRVVLHSHFELVKEYGLRGAHLGVNRQLEVPDFRGTLSYSCHSIAEVSEQKARYDYVFLSPIFNSISKQGYNAAFSTEELAKAFESGIIDKTVVALGGVTPYNFSQVKAIGFGGVALLGDIWQDGEPLRRFSEYLRLNV